VNAETKHRVLGQDQHNKLKLEAKVSAEAELTFGANGKDGYGFESKFKAGPSVGLESNTGNDKANVNTKVGLIGGAKAEPTMTFDPNASKNCGELKVGAGIGAGIYVDLGVTMPIPMNGDGVGEAAQKIGATAAQMAIQSNPLF